MDKRTKIGLLFSVSEGWIGGSYYFLNIIAALNTLDDARKPTIIIYSNDLKSYQLAEQSRYPYLVYASSVFYYTYMERVINKISRIFFKSNMIKKGISSEVMPLLFGYYEQLALHYCNNKIFWIPDFQEHYYPNFIGLKETNIRKASQKSLVKAKAKFIFSSKDALNDFNKFYPYNECNTSIVHFAVKHPDYSGIKLGYLQKKYNLPESFFFTPNQFWPHKNHLTLFKSIKHAKDQGVNISIVLTGKANVNDKYVNSLHNYVKDNMLDSNVIFLGFISREEQLCIMSHSIAVVQPSLFEGWSTVVEDAKAMNQFLILSDLRVHREQTVDYGCLLFEPENEIVLANHLISAYRNKPKQNREYEYKKNIAAFAEDFLMAINS